MTFMTAQSDRAENLSSIANPLQIADKLNIVSQSQLLETLDEDPANLPSAAQADAGMPVLEPSSDPRPTHPADENADSRDRRLSPDSEAGRPPVPPQGDAKRDDSRLFSLALLSAFGVATFGWLWFLFEVGKWLLDF